MKKLKLMIIGIIIILLISLVFSLSSISDYSKLGYIKNTTVITKVQRIDGCFKVTTLDSDDYVRTKAVEEADIQLDGRKANSPVTMELKPKQDLACWKSSYIKDITQIDIIYTNKTLFDSINDDSFDMNTRVWKSETLK